MAGKFAVRRDNSGRYRLASRTGQGQVVATGRSGGAGLTTKNDRQAADAGRKTEDDDRSR